MNATQVSPDVFRFILCTSPIPESDSSDCVISGSIAVGLDVEHHFELIRNACEDRLALLPSLLTLSI